MNSHYKDKSPADTIALIKNILKDAKISTIDQFPEYENEGTFSLRTNIKGTAVGQNGKGISKEYAVASAYAEFMERLQNDYLFQFNYSGDFLKEQDFYNFSDEKIISASEFVEVKNDFLNCLLKSTGMDSLPEQEQVKQIRNNYRQTYLRYQKEGLLAYPYYSLKDDKLYDIPVEMCTQSYLSSGMCAGNTMEEALIQGLSEIWERHIHKMVLDEGISLPEIPEQYIKEHYKNIWDLLQKFKGNPDFTVMMKDASLGGVYPAAMLIITDKKNHSYGVRFGAHIDLGIAMERTITEALQGKRMRDFTSYCIPDCTDREVDKYYNRFNSLKVGCSNYYVKMFYEKSKYQFSEPPAFQSNAEALQIYLKRILEEGYDILLRDVSYLGFPSFHMIIPGFSEVFPPDLKTARLHNTVQYVSEIIRNLGNLDHRELNYIVKLIDSKEDCIIEGDFPAFYRLPLQIQFPFNELENGITVLGAFIRYAQEDFEDALLRFDRYIGRMKMAGAKIHEYVLCSREYIANKIKKVEHSDIQTLLSYFYQESVVDRVCHDLREESKALSFIYPQLNCYDCNSCKYSKECGYREVEAIKRTLKEKQAGQTLNQEHLAERVKALRLVKDSH